MSFPLIKKDYKLNPCCIKKKVNIPRSWVQRMKGVSFVLGFLKDEMHAVN